MFNKVRFIQLVIAGTIKINKQKRQAIMLQCKTHKLKTWTELQAIMHKFIKNEQVRTKVAKNSANNDDEASADEG